MEIVYKKGICRGTARIKDGKVLLTIPFAMKGNQAFLVKMEELGQKLQKKFNQKAKNQIFSLEGVLLFGERVPLSDLPSLHDSKSRNAFFKAELFAYADPLLQTIAEKLGFKAIPLSIRQVKTRRGSCTHDNRIMLNQQLVHLPTKLIQYVIIHEACHLVEKNHSPDFWKLVSDFCPAFKSLRKELKDQVFNF